jgi:tetratricopeptide (TPR) repeat protein
LGGSLDIAGQSDRAAPCYRESLDLFAARGDEHEVAHTRFRVAANMVLRGEEAAAWPLLEEALRESREIGSRLGEGQALAFLARKAHAEGDLARACELVLESADIARAAGWSWWEAAQLHNAAVFERERGRLDEAEAHARRAFELSLGLGGRQNILYTAAELAIIAAARGDAARAGRLWGAVESEADAGPVGAWDDEVVELERLILRVEGPEFAAARAEGALLSVAEAAGLESPAD